MLKKILVVLFVLIMIGVAYFSYSLWINPKSPASTAIYTSETLNIEVAYNRPYKRGRLIFGTQEQNALLEYGKYWRLGANAPTTIKMDRDVLFAGNELKAGKYRLYAIPYDNRWELFVNTEMGLLGYSPPDKAHDLFSVSVPLTSPLSPMEQFTISFENTNMGVEMIMQWDNHKISIPIQ